MYRGSKVCTVIRVGIVFGFDENWLGGINYFRNLVNAVYEYPQRQIDIVIFTGASVETSKLQGFPPVEIVRSRLLDSASFGWRIRRLIKRIFKRDVLLERLLLKHHIAVLSHSGWLGKRSRIPTLGWIPDFQIFRLAEFFSKNEAAALATEFEYIGQYCSKAVVSSNDALRDFNKFLPSCEAKAQVLNFAVKPPARDDLPALNVLRTRYGFQGDYFLLPNQFWAHKNHRVVLNALAHLKAEGHDVLVLATGNTKDYRQPGYFNELLEYAEKLRVTNCFKVLGIVPLNDLHALMHHALAIINPSLFEGWSTTVEEGKSMGKTIVLSDIAVHREQNPQGARFFQVDDPEMLAEHLLSLWEKNVPSALVSVTQTDEQAMVRYQQFAERYQQLIVSLL